MLRILFGQIFPFIRKAVKQNSDTIYKKKRLPTCCKNHCQYLQDRMRTPNNLLQTFAGHRSQIKSKKDNLFCHIKIWRATYLLFRIDQGGGVESLIVRLNMSLNIMPFSGENAINGHSPTSSNS